MKKETTQSGKKKSHTVRNILLIVLGAFLVSQVFVYWRFLRKQPVKSFAEATHSYKSFELNCDNEGRKIYGIAYVPDDVDGRLPTVIMSHGYGAALETWKETAESLAMSGIACYTFDFCGGNEYGRSDGTMLEMTAFTEVDDLLHVIEQIKTQDFVDSDNLFLMGESLGGMVTAITATQTDGIKGLVLYYPALCIPDNVRAEYSSVDEIPDEVPTLRHTVGKAYYSELLDYDVYQVIGDYKGPVLIMHGTADNIVDYSYSERAVHTYENAELVPFKGEMHGFSAGGRVTAANMAYDFIADLIG